MPMKNSLTKTVAAVRNLKNLAAESRRLSEKITEPLTPAQLSRELRFSGGQFLPQRRAIIGLSLVAIAAMGVVAFYQTGIIRHLPQPPIPGLDSDKVDAAPEAYERLAAPDATLAVGSYAATLVLAAMGSKQRARHQPWLPLALAGKVGFDLAQIIRMVRVQWGKYRALCFWALISGAATVASFPLVFREARAAVREIGNPGEPG
jgi:hypothetical protein